MSNFGALFSRLIEMGVPAEEAAQVLHDAVTIGVNSVKYRNPEIEKVEARREKDRERKAAERAASKEIRGNPQTSEDSADDSVSLDKKDPDPKKLISSPKENPPKGGQKKGTRLPPDWKPSEEDAAFARQQGAPESEIPREAEKFRNHFHGKAGKDALKLDWPATWRNWVLKAAEWRGWSPPITAAGVASVTTWVTDEDRRWPALAARYTAKHGRPLSPISSKHERGLGWHFPNEWLASAEAAA